MVDTINVIIAGIAALTAAIAAGITFHQAKRSWYIDIISPERLTWAENLRNALSKLFDAYYQQDQKKLYAARDNVFLYLTPSNENHQGLINEIKRMVNSEITDLSSVVEAAQKLLGWNWHTVKSESAISKAFEVRRDELAKKRALERGETVRQMDGSFAWPFASE